MLSNYKAAVYSNHFYICMTKETNEVKKQIKLAKGQQETNRNTAYEFKVV